MLIPVILSGGAGVRLWPESREARPKPFLKAGATGESLLLECVRRAQGLADTGRPVVVTNQDHLFQSLDELAKASGPVEYLLEGAGRNTAAAVLLAAHHLLEVHGPEAVMLVLAADHIIRDGRAFADAVALAHGQAAKGLPVTFGLKPSRPETGYGYLKLGASPAPGVRAVERFVEKPTAPVAAEYVASGQYLWNSGMFCFRVDALLALAEAVAPELAAQVAACHAKREKGREGAVELTRFPRAAMMDVASISVDYALMEKAPGVVTIPCDLGWSDVGAWDAVWDVSSKDASGNATTGDVALVGVTNSLIRSSGRLVSAVGVHDLLIVDTPDALLVADRSQAQEVKTLVAGLKKTHPDLCVLPATVQRPWGTYTVLAEGPQYKVKRIEVKVGGRLSLQKHAHRSEHWVVVSGTARVTNGDAVLEVHPNQSTYIPVGNVHRLENVGLIPLVMIEVQSGEYLGEDDIVRLDDIYRR